MGCVNKMWFDPYAGWSGHPVHYQVQSYPQTPYYPPVAWPDDPRFARPFQATMLYPIPVMTTHGTRWGYINDRGAVFIRPQFDFAHDFQKNGLAIVDVHGRSGIIRLSGEYLVKPVFASITEFSEGRAAVSDGQGYRVIDESGHVLTPHPFSYIGTFHDGRALFTPMGEMSKYGYLDLQGHIVIPPVLQSAGDFRNGKAVVQIRENEYALIGLDGRRLATYHYPYVGPLGEGLLAFQQAQNRPYGYLNEQGQVVISPRYAMALPFEGGRAIVNNSSGVSNKYGLIDRNGKYILPPEYNDIQWLGDQRIAVGKAIDPEQPFIGSKYALAESNRGHLLTDYMFYGIEPYKNGMASADDGQRVYFIDRNGRPAPHTPKVEGSGTLRWVGSLISANVDQRQSYYDRWGRLVWRPSTVIPLTGTLRVKEGKYKPNRNYLVYYPQVEGMEDAKVQREVNEKLKSLSQIKPIPADQPLEYSYTGDFQIGFFKKNLLVLQLNGYNYPFGAAHGMPSMIYANLNLMTGEFYELQDLFKPGSPYVQVLSEIVGKMIKTDPQYSYVFPDTYKGISPDQPFYVTEDALHLYFAPYEIAPYAAGFPTFNIPFRMIEGIINKEGSFWQSFH